MTSFRVADVHPISGTGRLICATVLTLPVSFSPSKPEILVSFAGDRHFLLPLLLRRKLVLYSNQTSAPFAAFYVVSYELRKLRSVE